MAYPINHGLKEGHLNVYVSSIGATPTVGYAAVSKYGRIVGIKAVQSAAVTGTSAIAVAINGGTAIPSLALSITGGSAGTEFSASTTLADLDSAAVNENDVISITPSGATGTASATFTLIIRS